MESIQWFVLGVLFTLCVFAFAYASVRIKAPWYAWVVLIGGAFLVMFGIAWSGSSFIEGIPVSGAMGLTLFGDQSYKMPNVTGVYIPDGVVGDDESSCFARSAPSFRRCSAIGS